MKVNRFPENPIIVPSDIKPSRDDFEVICVFNPGVIKYNREILLLLRVAERPINEDPNTVAVPVVKCENGKWPDSIEVLKFNRDEPTVDISDPRIVRVGGRTYLTSISHLRIARSKDGRKFEVESKPSIAPDRASESFGIEDPRITDIGGAYCIVYKSVAPTGITQSLAVTRNFKTFEKFGVVMPPENMDGILFPSWINGKYAMLHRPFPHMIGSPDVWISYSDDLVYWGEHKHIAGAGECGWDSGRIGGGAVPFLTSKGWLVIYHGATPDNQYSLGAMLLDAECPERVIARSREPILKPEAPYETSGFMPNVVFTCGAVAEDDKLTLYYGAADNVVAAAELSVSELLASLES